MFARILLLLIGIGFAFPKYVYYPNRSVSSQYVILQLGSTHFNDLVNACDAIGMRCAGFDTNGNLLSPFPNTTQDTSLSLFIKTPGPSPQALPRLWPLPQQFSFGTQILTLATPFSFTRNIYSNILNSSIDHYQKIIFSQNYNQVMKGTLNELSIIVQNTDESLQFGVDESYSLAIDNLGAILASNTIYGAMRGLETFSQLVEYNYDNDTFEIKATPIKIVDYPTFPHRGLLIDVSRHYIPVVQIKKVIDSLSYAKMNVLHLHATDAQSWPIQSKSWPNLWQGAYSHREKYTQAQLNDIVSYGKQRGVRVIPEFDAPGHMASIGFGYPDLLPEGYEGAPGCLDVCPNNPCDVPLDPSNPQSYQMLSDFIGEMSPIFSDDFIHLGGDEVKFACWNASEQIQQFMQSQHFGSYDDLYRYFIEQYEAIANRNNKTIVHWEDVFDHFGWALPKDVIIHVYYTHTSAQNAIKAGFRVILSDNGNWYLDYTSNDWTIFYKNDPYEGIPANSTSMMLGGETCMWGEEVDASDQMQRIWPRAAAVAERLWTYESASEPNAIELAIPRLQKFRCNLLERGINTAPLYSPTPNIPGSCYDS